MVNNFSNIIKQFIKFGIVGISNTVISMGITYGIIFLFHKPDSEANEGLLVFLASLAGFLISVLNSYYWNNKYVFTTNEGEQRTWWQALIKTYISYAFTGLFLNALLSILWVEVFGWPKEIAPIINLLVSVPINFVMNKFWAFKKTAEE